MADLRAYAVTAGYSTNRSALAWDGQLSIGNVYATHFIRHSNGSASRTCRGATYVHLFKHSHPDAMSRLDEGAAVPAASPLRRIG